MKKWFLPLIVLVLIEVEIFSQPEINWQQCYGGTQAEGFAEIKLTDNNIIVFAGTTGSNDGNVTGNHGETDFWIGKIDENGTLLWQKCLGGSSWEYASSIDFCSDGGLIVAGDTRSNDGDVTGLIGYVDFWVVKTDSLGNIEWQKCLGGTSAESAYAIRQTLDGGFIVTGRTDSNDTIVTGNHGGDDTWVVKLDSLGDIEWQKCLGGSDEDWGNDICVVPDGYIVLSFAESNDGDVSGNHGDHDYWFVKLNLVGDIVWQKCYGGSDLDQGNSIISTNDNGCIAIGRTFSNDGNVSNNTGESDYWIVKLDYAGNLQWEKCFGINLGNSIDHGQSIYQTTDSGFIVGGFSFGATCHADWDYWVLKVSSQGNLEWDKCMGGSLGDEVHSVLEDHNGNFYVAGDTRSNNGDVSGNHGWVDSWLIKLGNQTDIESLKIKSKESLIKPNPAKDKITISSPAITGNTLLSIFTVSGEKVMERQLIDTETQMDISALPRGVYFVRVRDEKGVQVAKMVKE